MKTLSLITFTDEKGRKIKRAFERTYEKQGYVVGIIGNCDCYKNTCNCVTVKKIQKIKIEKNEQITVLAGDKK